MGDREIGRTAGRERAPSEVEGIGRSISAEIQRTEVDRDGTGTDGLIGPGGDVTAIDRRATREVGKAIEGQAADVVLSKRGCAAELRGEGRVGNEVVDQDVAGDRTSAARSIRQRAAREGQGIGDSLTTDIQSARRRGITLNRGGRGPQAGRIGQTGDTRSNDDSTAISISTAQNGQTRAIEGQNVASAHYAIDGQGVISRNGCSDGRRQIIANSIAGVRGDGRDDGTRRNACSRDSLSHNEARGASRGNNGGTRGTHQSGIGDDPSSGKERRRPTQSNRARSLQRSRTHEANRTTDRRRIRNRQRRSDIE